MTVMIPRENIQQLIYLARGQRVMLDHDLAGLYGVPTKALNQAVKRHRDRFPADFMFQLSKAEFENWRSHFVTSNSAFKMGLRRPPYAFTEHGVAMLSSVLNSKRAVQVNIAIVRVFIGLRRMLLTHRDLARKVSEHEKKITGLANDVRQLNGLIRPLLDGPVKKLDRLGFKP